MHDQEDCYADDGGAPLASASSSQAVICTGPRVAQYLWDIIRKSDEALIGIYMSIWPQDALELDANYQSSVEWAMRCSSSPKVVATLLAAGVPVVGRQHGTSTWDVLCSLPKEPAWHTYNV